MTDDDRTGLTATLVGAVRYIFWAPDPDADPTDWQLAQTCVVFTVLGWLLIVPMAWVVSEFAAGSLLTLVPAFVVGAVIVLVVASRVFWPLATDVAGWSQRPNGNGA